MADWAPLVDEVLGGQLQRSRASSSTGNPERSPSPPRDRSGSGSCPELPCSAVRFRML